MSGRGGVLRLAFGGVLAAGVVWAAVWLTGSSRIPAVPMPRGSVPHPNAYGYYVKAAAGIVDLGLVEKAGKLSRGKGAFSPARKERLVAANMGVLKAFRDAAVYGYRYPIDADVSENSKFRDLGYLLRLEGQVRAAKGDYAGAVGSYLDVLQMCEVMPDGGPFITWMMANHIQGIGRRDAWGLVDKLDAAEARAAAKRLEAMRARRLGLAQAMKDMKWYFADDVRQGQMPGPFMGNSRLSKTVGTFYVNKAMDEVFQTLDAYAANVNRPYPCMLYVGPITHSEWASMVERSCVTVCFGDTFSRAQNAMLNVTLALRAYRVEHGKYPAGLAELTPSYLKSVPNDPFASAGQLGYKRYFDGFILYSVGPDGVDDGGRSIGGKPINERSLGDIVAGADLEMEPR